MSQGFKYPYQIVVRDKQFNLSREQLAFEPGNTIEQFYLLKSPSGLPGNNILKVDRHPSCFTLILDHLSGYEVFPLSDEECHRAGMDRDTFLRYLAADAIYYSFPNFADRTKKEMIRIRAEEIKVVKQKNESDQEIAKIHLEAEKLRLESEKANLKDKHDHEIRMLQLQHEYAREFKRLEIFVERSRQLKEKDVDIASHLSPMSPKVQSPDKLFDHIQDNIEDILRLTPGSLGRSRPWSTTPTPKH